MLHCLHSEHYKYWAFVDNLVYSQNHRISEAGRDFKEIIESNHLSKQVPYNGWHRQAPKWILNISLEGEFMTFLDSLFQCSIILIIKKFFHMLLQNFLHKSFRPLLLALFLHTTKIHSNPEDFPMMLWSPSILTVINV